MSRLGLALSACALLLVAGCVTPSVLTPADAGAIDGLTDVRTRAALPFELTDEFSRVLVNGTIGILPVESVFVPVKLPATEGGSAADGSAKVHMGLFLPDVPAGTKVPVIADVGPYYGDGDLSALEPADRLGRFLIENFVPKGYAVAQVSVFGTGESNHCMDLMGPAEQAGIDAAVTWLGEQEWSNGNVGLIGRSYDGSTPWEAAAMGNEHLKTIVPISGLIGAYDLMWRNGTAETRGPIMHNGVYGRFGIDSDPAKGKVDPGDRYTLCNGYLQGPANGAAAYATGAPMTPYWKDRSFLDRALKNYDGSVYFIHGLQDWNVDPHMAFPTYQKLEEAGIETKGLFGQWGHMYPDRLVERESLREGRGKEATPANVRMDWAQDLLEWFDHYLQGTGPKPALHVEVQDNMGGWRIEDTYPPLDATWTERKLAEGKAVHGSPHLVYPNVRIGWELPALSDTEDTRIAGLAQLKLKVTPTGPGGQVYVILTDAETKMHLGHAIMDVRYAAGGDQAKPVVPGMPIEMQMEFEAFDVVLPAGHGLLVMLSGTGEDYLPSAVSSPVNVDPSGSTLRLPVIVRGEDAFFTPPMPVGDGTGKVTTT